MIRYDSYEVREAVERVFDPYAVPIDRDKVAEFKSKMEEVNDNLMLALLLNNDPLPALEEGKKVIETYLPQRMTPEDDIEISTFLRSLQGL